MSKKCKKCNEEILDNQKFCPNCGTKQSEEWYYLKDKEPVGPYSDEEIVALYTNGTIQKDTYVWYEGMEEWVSLDKSGLPIVVEEVVNTIENEKPLDVEPMASEEVDQDQKELINGWFIANEGGPLGPYTEEEMIGFIQNKEIDEQTFIWSEGLRDWISVKESKFSSYLSKEEKEWYYAKGENKYGPLTYSELLNVCNNGGITSQDYIWKQGWKNWEVASQTEFSKYCVQTVQAETQGQPVVQKKSKKGLLFILAAAILLSVGGGAYVAYQNKVNAELKQAEEAKAKKEAEKKKQEEKKKKAEEEAKKKEEQEKKEEEAKKLAEEKAKKKEEAKKNNSIPGVYSQVIEDYRGTFANKDVSHIRKYGIDSLQGYPMTGDSINHSNGWCYGYLLQDINGDGIEELIVGSNPEAQLEGAPFSPIVAIFTIYNGKLAYVCESVTPNECVELGKDGTIYVHDNSVMSNSQINYDRYQLQGGVITVIDKPTLDTQIRNEKIDSTWQNRMTLFESN